MKELYFDNATTTRVDEEVLKAMIPYLSDNYGNPSAIYGVARITRGQSAVFYINDIVIGGGKII